MFYSNRYLGEQEDDYDVEGGYNEDSYRNPYYDKEENKEENDEYLEDTLEEPSCGKMEDLEIAEEDGSEDTLIEKCATDYEGSDQVGKIYTKEEWKKIIHDFNLNGYEHEEAGNKIAGALYPFIIFLARRFYGTYFVKYGPDMIQEGYLGVMESIRTYDPDRGKPTTWCSRSIIHNMREFVSHTVHNTTPHYRSNIREIRHIIDSRQNTNESVTKADIQIEQNLSPTTIEACLIVDKRNASRMSIDQTIEDSKVRVADLIPSSIPDPESICMKRSEAETICNAMNICLTAEEFKVITLHYGLNDNKTRSLEEISKITGIPKQYLRSIVNGALTKLEACLSAKGMYHDAKKEHAKMHDEIDESFSHQLEAALSKIITDDLHSFDLSGLESF